MKNRIAASTQIFLLLVLISWCSPALSTAVESKDMKIKKIVMMLNIVTKEYFEGISNGKIINAAEYEESQVFLEQAFDRYRSIKGNFENAQGAAKLEKEFESATEMVKARVEPAEVRSRIAGINSGLLELSGTKISISPTTPVSLENGKKIFETNCSVCHGLTGNGDGPLASTLDPAPAVFTDPQITGDENTAAYDNFQVINVGIANTAMVPWAEVLTEPEIWDVTYYIRTFSNASVKLPLISAAMTTGADTETSGRLAEQTLAEINQLLDQSIEAYRNKQVGDAADLAFDAYLTYEKIEGGLINKRKELGLKLESAFSRYRAEIKREADLTHVEKLLAGIRSDLDQALEVLREEIGFFGLFIQSLSIIVREGFEAILIIAALIAFLKKSRNQDKLKTIYAGVVVGIVGSFLTAYILKEVFQVSMASQELMEGWIMLIAVVVLFWVSYWLVTKIEAQKWQSYITGKMKQAVSTGSAFTLGMVAFLSVYREGFETVLFYKALYLYAGPSTAGIIPGFLVGCGILAVVYYLINQLGVRVPIKWFFAVTSVFLYFMAFVFMGKGLHELQMGEALSITPVEFLPQIPWLGMYPTMETFIGQAILALLYIGALVYTFGIKPEVQTKQLRSETHNIQRDITLVHDLVEHISHHAKRCEIFLKDTRDQDLKELSEHLKEIDQKVHELFDHVRYVENQILDEYEKLGKEAYSASEKETLA